MKFIDTKTGKKAFAKTFDSVDEFEDTAEVRTVGNERYPDKKVIVMDSAELAISEHTSAESLWAILVDDECHIVGESEYKNRLP